MLKFSGNEGRIGTDVSHDKPMSPHTIGRRSSQGRRVVNTLVELEMPRAPFGRVVNKTIGTCHIRLQGRFRNPIPEDASSGDFHL